MELNESTLQVLKNFSGINQNLLIKQGNKLKTINESRTVLSSATVLEDFPNEIGIYDLNEFINVLSLVDTPRLNFSEDFITIGDSTGRSKVKYFYSAEDTLTTPQKDITMPESDVKFVLTNDVLNKLKRAAGALGHEEVSISNKGKLLSLSVIDTKNTTSNTFSIDIDGEFDENKKFNFVLNIGNLKILPGDYDIQISQKLISQFTHKGHNVQYWIALEKSSIYGEK